MLKKIDPLFFVKTDECILNVAPDHSVVYSGECTCTIRICLFGNCLHDANTTLKHSHSLQCKKIGPIRKIALFEGITCGKKKCPRTIRESLFRNCTMKKQNVLFCITQQDLSFSNSCTCSKESLVKKTDSKTAGMIVQWPLLKAYLFDYRHFLRVMKF